MHVQFPVEGNSNSEVDLQSLPPIEEDMEFGLVLTPQGLVLLPVMMTDQCMT